MYHTSISSKCFLKNTQEKKAKGVEGRKKTFSIKAESSGEGSSSQIAIWNVNLVFPERRKATARKKESLSLSTHDIKSQK
jgi:hypothetical protein